MRLLLLAVNLFVFPRLRPLQTAEPIPANAPRPFPEVEASLRESPNNPGYLDSELYARLDNWLKRHEHAISAQLQAAIEDLGFEHAEADIQQLRALRGGDSWRIDGDPDNTVHGVYLAEHIAYPDVTRAIVDEFRETTAEDGAKTINNRAILAIGATMLRAEYMNQLAYRFPDTRALRGEAPFQSMFRRKILAIIQLAARLESEAQPSPATPELHLITQ